MRVNKQRFVKSVLFHGPGPSDTLLRKEGTTNLSTNHRTRTRVPNPVIRHCALCGQPRAVLPPSPEHRRAHLSREIAFVCEDCAMQVRQQVEAAADLSAQPKATA